MSHHNVVLRLKEKGSAKNALGPCVHISHYHPFILVSDSLRCLKIVVSIQKKSEIFDTVCTHQHFDIITTVNVQRPMKLISSELFCI